MLPQRRFHLTHAARPEAPADIAPPCTAIKKLALAPRNPAGQASLARRAATRCVWQQNKTMFATDATNQAGPGTVMQASGHSLRSLAGRTDLRVQTLGHGGQGAEPPPVVVVVDAEGLLAPWAKARQSETRLAQAPRSLNLEPLPPAWPTSRMAARCRRHHERARVSVADLAPFDASPAWAVHPKETIPEGREGRELRSPTSRARGVAADGVLDQCHDAHLAHIARQHTALGRVCLPPAGRD
mmetsp:Transcript_32724/g.98959  ORF Transcript_32724/g.98959 Transcript_32724/m.98959 type:complete len:242 (-) Transcript_32724:158-883(-)